jgi:hypothetical protein
VIGLHVPLRVLRETGYSQPETAVMYDFDDLTGSYVTRGCATPAILALRRRFCCTALPTFFTREAPYSPAGSEFGQAVHV